MSSEGSFHDLLIDLEAGDQDAAAKIFERYSQLLIAKARGRLNADMNRQFDAEDVVQSVYRSFFHRQGQGQYELENWESLWGLLITITLRKCGRKIDFFYADRRDVRRERQLNTNDADSVMQWEAIAHEPLPEEAAILTEDVQGLLESFNSKQQNILSLCLQGFTQQEVSEQAGCSERTVRRLLSTARLKLKNEE